MRRPRQTFLQLEVLESRQLLATVSGSGEEVGSDIAFQGNNYDQVLMTGQSMTVDADSDQIVRTSFLDGNGDIVQAEFSGAGSLNIFLIDFISSAEAEKYNQPGVEYVTGQASFTIEGSDETTNFSLHTVGPVTSPVWESLSVEGIEYDGIADAVRLNIIADTTSQAGSAFGGIRMANSLLSGDLGVVGISAPNVQVNTTVVIGDIDARDTGVPVLKFGDDSQFDTLVVAGGDLSQTNNLEISGENFDTASFIHGTTSHFEFLPAKLFVGEWAGAFFPLETILDDSTVGPIDITGLSQSELDAIFLGRDFVNDIIIEGDLPLQNNISAANFRGNVSFDGEIKGPIDVNKGVAGDLIFKGVSKDSMNPGADDRDITTDVTLGRPLMGQLIFGAEESVDAVNYSGIFMAPSIEGAVWLHGDFSGELTTDLDDDRVYDSGEGSLNKINVSGDFSGNAVGILGIGDVWIGGDLTTTADEGATAFLTASETEDDTLFASIGTLNIEGDVDQSNASDKLIRIKGNGSFGDIIIKGEGSLGETDNTDYLSIGDIRINGAMENDSTGSITIMENTADLEILSIEIESGTLGNLTIMGPGTVNTDLLLSGVIGGMDSMLGDITITGFQTIDQDAAFISSTIGDVSYNTNTPNSTDNTLIDIDNFIESSGDIGKILLNAGSSDSLININAMVSAADVDTIDIVGETINLGRINANNVGDITITGTANLNDDITANSFGIVTIDGNANILAEISGSEFGAVTIMGDLTFSNGGALISTNILESLEVNGDSTFDEVGIQVADSGVMTFRGDVTFGPIGPSIVADDGTSELDVIDGIVIEGKVTGAFNFDIIASAIGDISITGNLAEGEVLVDYLGIAALNNGGLGINAETVAIDGSNLSDYTIGNVTITHTNTLGVTNTTLFDGLSSFQTLGGIGNITLSGGGSAAVQAGLFADTDAELNIVVGNGKLGLTSDAGIDFDGDGAVGTVSNDTNISAADESSANFTNGAVSIGDVTINTAFKAADNIDTIDGATQLLILSAVESPPGDRAFDGDVDSASPNDPASSVQAIDDDLDGTIGDILLYNLSQLLTIVTTGAPVTLEGIVNSGGIFANGLIGSVQGIDHSTDLDQTGEGLLIGNDNTETASDLGEDEVIVMLV